MEAQKRAASVGASSPVPPTLGSGVDVVDLEDSVEGETVVQPQGKRQKKSTSPCWEHFTKSFEWVVVDGKKVKQEWAQCNHCKYKALRNSKNGTSVFLNHAKTHNLPLGQQVLRSDKSVDGSSNPVEPYKYDQEVSLRKLYLAIIMHEYPFCIVEHEYFVEFIKSLRPTFPMKSRITVRKELMAIFIEEREKLYAHFKTVNSRFSATMDMWTSNQNKGYMCITVHWIDENWNIQKRIVNFMHVEGRHTGLNLSEAFNASMMRWFIDNKMFSLTLDNAAANEVAVNDIIAEIKKNSPLVCDGLFFHVRCANHILNLVARDGLQQIADAILNIRSIVLVVKCSPPQWEDFMRCASECMVKTNRGLSLDVQTRWNSTYHMLRDALHYRKAFDRLYNLDKKRYAKIAPSAADWEKAETLCKCLKRFSDITELLSGTLYPTANLFYQSFSEAKALILEWCSSEDETIRNMGNSMNTKFEKYWKKSNVALAVAFFLDPRFKKKALEYLMKKVHGPLLYRTKVEEFLSVVKLMYETYAASYSKSATGANSNTEPSTDDFMEEEEEDNDFEKFLYESHGRADEAGISDLDKYMSDATLRLSKASPEVDNFDILSWWKNHQGAYPILSLLARDVLAMQASTVASESAFSAGGRVIDPFRSRLEPEMVEALICTKDWVGASRADSNRRVASILKDLEVVETLVANITLEDLHEQEQQMSSDDGD